MIVSTTYLRPTITFAIPCAPKSKIDYWDLAMKNLYRTLTSLRMQSSASYRTILIGQEEDVDDLVNMAMKFPNTKIDFVDTIEEFSADKDRKTLLALKHHMFFGSKFFFRLDWDDLVHKDLVKYIEENNEENGWYMNWGYFYSPKRNAIIPVQNYWYQCGSSFAIKYSVEECQNGPIHSFHHQQILKNREVINKPLKVLPFFAGAYTIHGKNISTEKHERVIKENYWQPVNEEFNQSFSLVEDTNGNS